MPVWRTTGDRRALVQRCAPRAAARTPDRARASSVARAPGTRAARPRGFADAALALQNPPSPADFSPRARLSSPPTRPPPFHRSLVPSLPRGRRRAHRGRAFAALEEAARFDPDETTTRLEATCLEVRSAYGLQMRDDAVTPVYSKHAAVARGGHRSATTSRTRAARSSATTTTSSPTPRRDCASAEDDARRRRPFSSGATGRRVSIRRGGRRARDVLRRSVAAARGRRRGRRRGRLRGAGGVPRGRGLVEGEHARRRVELVRRRPRRQREEEGTLTKGIAMSDSLFSATARVQAGRTNAAATIEMLTVSAGDWLVDKTTALQHSSTPALQHSCTRGAPPSRTPSRCRRSVGASASPRPRPTVPVLAAPVRRRRAPSFAPPRVARSRNRRQVVPATSATSATGRAVAPSSRATPRRGVRARADLRARARLPARRVASRARRAPRLLLARRDPPSPAPRSRLAAIAIVGSSA